MKNKQSNTVNVVSDNFIVAYGMVPADYQTPLRKKIMDECDWQTDMTFHSKRKGDVKIRKPEVPVIEAAFAEYNINAWTGEYIKPFAK
jgi:hypothetical protein